MTADDLREGIFAVDKPASVSSADVLIILQDVFAKSETFRTLLEDTARKRAEQATHQPQGQKRRSDEDERPFKMGHGGTLDPLASGVLIVGIGRGTKRLSDYLGCSKTYETVVLFGKSTDTYDVTGDIIDDAPFKHITRELVENALHKFVGTVQQAPPIYSALRINGIKACEYARSGRELPRALESREMSVDECTLLQWYEGNQHDFAWPAGEPSTDAGLATHGMQTSRCPAPAVRVRLTVSSGFYVRSFAHDLGRACGSYGTMATLRRTRQANFATADFSMIDNHATALDFERLQSGEDLWGPELRSQLSDWMMANEICEKQHVNGRDPNAKRAAALQSAAHPRQRHRGERQASTRRERRKQSKLDAAKATTVPTIPVFVPANLSTLSLEDAS